MDLNKLEAAAKALKTLIAEQKTYERLRDKAGNTDIRSVSQKQMQKLSTDMIYQAMHVRRCHKDAWKAICAADLETTINEQEATPHGYQNYRI